MIAERSDGRNEASEVMIRFGTGVYPGCQVEKIQTPEYVLVCSPGLLDGVKPLRTPKDLVQHILIHDESISVLEKRPSWLEWFNLAGVSNIDTERGPRFSNSILAMEAVFDGQGVALALKPQIEADLAAGRLVTPFEISLPSAYAYYLVTPNAIAGNSAVIAFRKWLLAEGG